MFITEDIKYIGVDDKDIDLFEGHYKVPYGISYNSYVCLDEKIAVFDTVDDRKTEEWLENLKNCLGDTQPDYLIVSHVEPDHSASIPAFLKYYPSATADGNDKTFMMLNKFYGDIFTNKLIVKEGDELNLGRHILKFIFAPMVHWPEVMMCFDETDAVLFTADAFGKFGVLSHDEQWADEARRYYINIVGKYGNLVQAILKKVSNLNVNIICPLHGPVLTENLGFYIGKYNVWSLYKPEEEGVLIAYASVYGNTAFASKKLAEELKSRGVKTEVVDLNRCDIAGAVASAFRFSKLVVASITYDGGIMPCMDSFINILKSKNFSNRKVGFIQNGSWAPASAKIMRTGMENLKDISFCNTVVTVISTLDDDGDLQIKTLADELSNR